MWWNVVAVLLVGTIGLLTLGLAPAYSDTYCTHVREAPEESRSGTQGASYWPFGTRCTYNLPDGSVEIVGPGTASAILSPVLVALWVATVGLGLVAPPTRFWRRASWVVLAPLLPLGLSVLSKALPSPLDGVLFLVALCIGVGLVVAAPSAGLFYLLRPEQCWWVFPGAWLAWSLTVLVLYLTLVTTP